MKQTQAVKIKCIVLIAGFAEQIKRALQRVQQVGANIVGIGQGQAPADVVRHMARVPPLVSVGFNRCRAGVGRLAARTQRALHVAANPPFLKPADMAQLPQRRVDGGKPGHHKVDRFERFLVLAKKVQRMIARIHECQ